MNGLDRRILRLAAPNLLASVSVPLLGIVDTAMIGHLPKVAYLGAVATASVIFDVVFWWRVMEWTVSPFQPKPWSAIAWAPGTSRGLVRWHGESYCGAWG